MDIIQNFLKQWMFFDIQTTCNLETWNMVMSLRSYHQYSFLCKNELDKYSNTKETILIISFETVSKRQTAKSIQ